MSKTIEEWKAASGYDDLLAAHSAALTERDALRAEVERLRDDQRRVVDRVVALVVERNLLLRAAQSLHRAWKRERDLVERYQRDHDEWMWNTDTCDCAICNDVRMTK